jgi:hypothetical protein
VGLRLNRDLAGSQWGDVTDRDGGHPLTKPAFIGAQGEQTLDPPDGRPASAPADSVLPPAVASDSSELANWSNLVVLSSNCDKGVVSVLAFRDGTTVGQVHLQF